jgi:hypothetical protein
MKYFRELFSVVLVLLVFSLFTLFLPGIALAQPPTVDVADAVSGLIPVETMIKIAFWISIALILVEALKRVCAKIPGKKDDEIVGWIEFILRWTADLLAGRPADPSDPSLLRKD